jgi:hypothetical protein
VKNCSKSDFILRGVKAEYNFDKKEKKKYAPNKALTQTRRQRLNTKPTQAASIRQCDRWAKLAYRKNGKSVH